jgi:ribose 5-phosphate isomerase B
MQMTLVFASDHAGRELRWELINHMRPVGVDIIDLGTHTTESVDYPDYAHRLCDELVRNPKYMGVLICGTGIGMSIAANRHPHIRCAVATSPEMARWAREHNDANVLALGARVIDAPMARLILDTFLVACYEAGTPITERHDRRLAKLTPPA